MGPNLRDGRTHGWIDGLLIGPCEKAEKELLGRLRTTKILRYDVCANRDTEHSSLVSQTLVDIELFTDIHRIEDALSKHSCTEALVWCNENKNALRKIKVSALYTC
jgi:hypothetical protein